MSHLQRDVFKLKITNVTFTSLVSKSFRILAFYTSGQENLVDKQFQVADPINTVYYSLLLFPRLIGLCPAEFYNQY